MEVHVNNPELQARVNRWVSETGRSADELAEDAMIAYLDELAQIRQTLDRRYDDIKSGTVKPIPGEEIEAYFHAKSAARRSPRA